MATLQVEQAHFTCEEFIAELESILNQPNFSTESISTKGHNLRQLLDALRKVNSSFFPQNESSSWANAEQSVHLVQLCKTLPATLNLRSGYIATLFGGNSLIFPNANFDQLDEPFLFWVIKNKEYHLIKILSDSHPRIISESFKEHLDKLIEGMFNCYQFEDLLDNIPRVLRSSLTASERTFIVTRAKYALDASTRKNLALFALALEVPLETVGNPEEIIPTIFMSYVADSSLPGYDRTVAYLAREPRYARIIQSIPSFSLPFAFCRNFIYTANERGQVVSTQLYYNDEQYATLENPRYSNECTVHFKFPLLFFIATHNVEAVRACLKNKNELANPQIHIQALRYLLPLILDPPPYTGETYLINFVQLLNARDEVLQELNDEILYKLLQALLEAIRRNYEDAKTIDFAVRKLFMTLVITEYSQKTHRRDVKKEIENNNNFVHEFDHVLRTARVKLLAAPNPNVESNNELSGINCLKTALENISEVYSRRAGRILDQDRNRDERYLQYPIEPDLKNNLSQLNSNIACGYLLDPTQLPVLSYAHSNDLVTRACQNQNPALLQQVLDGRWQYSKTLAFLAYAGIICGGLAAFASIIAATVLGVIYAGPLSLAVSPLVILPMKIILIQLGILLTGFTALIGGIYGYKVYEPTKVVREQALEYVTTNPNGVIEPMELDAKEAPTWSRLNPALGS